MTIQKIFDRKLPQKILLGLILNGFFGYLWPDLKLHTVNLFGGDEEHQSSAHTSPSKSDYTAVPNVKDEPHDLEKTVSAPLVGIGKAFQRYGSMFRLDFDPYALRSGSGNRKRRRSWFRLKRSSPATI